ncbi:MAG: hypothetical protein AB7I59_25580 [Geminicoccaceae bacterium]
MDIREEHVDYWVVYRLRELLLSTSELRHEITGSYSLFGSILCWILQHIRISEGDVSRPGDPLAREVLEALRTRSAFDLPWHCQSDVKYNPNEKQIVSLSKGERKDLVDLSMAENEFKLSAFGLLKMMRDAIARGDGRKVFPINKITIGQKRQLLGFRLELDWKRDKNFGSVELRLPDFHRIGGAIAQLYCDKLKVTTNNSFLEGEALQNVSEQPAA